VLRHRGGPIGLDDLPAEFRGGTPRRGHDSPADHLFDRMVQGAESFWSAVRPAFVARDLTRTDLETLIRRGLERSGGSYQRLATLFNVAPGDARRFQHFLRKHSCYVRLQRVKVPSGLPLTDAE
jgi:hypothetical protein